MSVDDEERRAKQRERSRRYQDAHAEQLRERARVWREANPEKVREAKRRYNEANREKVKESARRYYEENRGKERERNLRYNEAHREKRRDYERRWREANPEKHAERSARRRAREAGAPVVELLDRVAIIARDKSTCHICGKRCKPAELHLDHLVPISLGGEHSARNVRVACRDCNLRKGARAANDQLMMVG